MAMSKKQRGRWTLIPMASKALRPLAARLAARAPHCLAAAMLGAGAAQTASVEGGSRNASGGVGWTVTGRGTGGVGATVAVNPDPAVLRRPNRPLGGHSG